MKEIKRAGKVKVDVSKAVVAVLYLSASGEFASPSS